MFGDFVGCVLVNCRRARSNNLEAALEELGILFLNGYVKLVMSPSVADVCAAVVV